MTEQQPIKSCMTCAHMKSQLQGYEYCTFHHSYCRTISLFADIDKRVGIDCCMPDFKYWQPRTPSSSLGNHGPISWLIIAGIILFILNAIYNLSMR